MAGEIGTRAIHSDTGHRVVLPDGVVRGEPHRFQLCRRHRRGGRGRGVLGGAEFGFGVGCQAVRRHERRSCGAVEAALDGWRPVVLVGLRFGHGPECPSFGGVPRALRTVLRLQINGGRGPGPTLLAARARRCRFERREPDLRPGQCAGTAGGDRVGGKMGVSRVLPSVCRVLLHGGSPDVGARCGKASWTQAGRPERERRPLRRLVAAAFRVCARRSLSGTSSTVPPSSRQSWQAW